TSSRWQRKCPEYIRSARGRSQFQILFNDVRGLNDDAVGVKESRCALPQMRLVESENPVRPCHRGGQSRFQQPLKIHCEIKPAITQFAAVAQPGPRITALEDGDLVDVRVAFKKRRPLRFDEPGEVRSRKAVLERSYGRQRM